MGILHHPGNPFGAGIPVPLVDPDGLLAAIIAATGPRTCTGYIWATVTAATPRPGGGYTFRTYATWVYNDRVLLTAPS